MCCVVAMSSISRRQTRKHRFMLLDIPARKNCSILANWVKPKIAIPVHGTPEHINANAVIAREVGVGKQLCGENGDLFRLAPQVSVKRKAVKVGRLQHDRNK